MKQSSMLSNKRSECFSSLLVLKKIIITICIVLLSFAICSCVSTKKQDTLVSANNNPEIISYYTRVPTKKLKLLEPTIELPPIEEKQIPVSITVLSKASPQLFSPIVLPTPEFVFFDKNEETHVVSRMNTEAEKKTNVEPEKKSETKPESKAQTKTETKQNVEDQKSKDDDKKETVKNDEAETPTKETEPNTEEKKAESTNKVVEQNNSTGKIVKDPLPKRTAETIVSVEKGDRFELRFPGSGWLYLGDELGLDGIKYETRRYEEGAAVFALTARKDGDYLLRFERQNPVDLSQDTSLVRVTIGKNSSSDKDTTKENDDKVNDSNNQTPIVVTSETEKQNNKEDNQKQETNSSVADSETTTTTTTIPTANTYPQDPDSIIAMARESLEANKIQNTIDILKHYEELFPRGSDEIYYLYALLYEQNTPFKNIKESYSYYKRIIDDYPRSIYWDKANERISWMEKHYFGLR